MIDRVANFLTSLKLTVVCLALALILVFVGTLAQVHLGLYRVQSEFFRSFFIYWSPTGSHWKIPVFPGGWLIGLALVMNLIAAHIKRFKFTRKKIGLIAIHLGLIILLLGQFLTEISQSETQMRISAGQTINYSEDNRHNELAIIDTTETNHDHVVAIPESWLAKGGDLQLPGLPLTLRVKKYYFNAIPAGPMSGGGEKIKAQQGLGRSLLFTAAPPKARMDDDNSPAALIEVLSGQQSLGDWTVSTWLTKYPFFEMLQQQIGGIMGPGVKVNAPQSFTVGGRTYQIALRPIRSYKPYNLSLQQFKHDSYAGTDIPKNFSSRIHLNDPSHGENRDVLIYMNNPLRYRGETFYQASFEEGDRGTILQVVRNPVSVAPYLACTLVSIGLLAQFMTHLFSFAKRRSKQPAPLPTSNHVNESTVSTPLSV